MPKKVLIFSLAYYPRVSGAEIAVKEITDRISAESIEFHMVTLRMDASPRESLEGRVHVHRIGLGNKGRLNSYLIEITQKVLGVIDAKAKKPIVDVIVDRAGQKGTGKWAVIEAQNFGVNASAIEAAVDARTGMGKAPVIVDRWFALP